MPELSRLTDRCAAALSGLGLKPGDVLAVQLSNRWELVPLALGCARAGVLICILDPAYRRRELEVMLAVSQARVMILRGSGLPQRERERLRVPHHPHDKIDRWLAGRWRRVCAPRSLPCAG